MNARARRMIEMAISARTGAGTVYRSVSPWELADILLVGKVTGRGARFSGDWKRTQGGIWTGETIPEVARHGQDWRRYLESAPEFWDGFRLKDAMLKEAQRVREDATAPPKADTIAAQMEKAGLKLQDALFTHIGKILGKHKERFAYVLEITGVVGGEVYSGEHSLSGGPKRPGEQWSPPEIKLPSGSVTLDHITQIHVVNDSGKVTKTYERPSGGWTAAFGAQGPKVPAVTKELAAVRKLVDKATEQFRTLNARVSDARREDAQRRREREIKQARKKRRPGDRSVWSGWA